MAELIGLKCYLHDLIYHKEGLWMLKITKKDVKKFFKKFLLNFEIREKILLILQFFFYIVLKRIVEINILCLPGCRYVCIQ